MTFTNFLIILVLFGLGVAIFLLWKQKRMPDEDKGFLEEVSRLREELKNETSRKDELAGRNKSLFVTIEDLKADNKIIAKDRDGLHARVSKFEAEEKRKNKEVDEKIKQLNFSRETLEDEKKRVRREDEERRQREDAQRDRMWAEHEENVKSQLLELCRSSQFGFKTYDNKNLPDGFDGKFKPDFMVEFLGQFVIFDAKVSRSDNLQNYIANTVKDTVRKIKGSHKIYPMVFFVVPTEAIGLLKKRYFYEEGYEFFVVAPEAIAVILSSLKRIGEYELAEQMDPRDRENIVNLIAAFDYHISFRNAVSVLSAQSGVEVLSETRKLRADLQEEISIKKGKMRLHQFAPTDIKTLMNTGDQQDRIHRLAVPKIAIPPSDIQSAAVKLSEKKGNR